MNVKYCDIRGSMGGIQMEGKNVKFELGHSRISDVKAGVDFWNCACSLHDCIIQNASKRGIGTRTHRLPWNDVELRSVKRCRVER